MHNAPHKLYTPSDKVCQAIHISQCRSSKNAAKPNSEMAKPYTSISKLLNPIPTQLLDTRRRSLNLSTSFAVRSSSERGASSAAASSDGASQEKKKKKKKDHKVGRRRRSLITIPTGGTWQSESCEYSLTLRELELENLAVDGEDAEVIVRLDIRKQCSFGLSIDGRIITSFNRKCSCCFSPYRKEIDTTFDACVLPSRNSGSGMREIGGDPSVMYVKPGSVIDLDSAVRDELLFTATSEDTCSESCEKSPMTWTFSIGECEQYNRRWDKLLELKKFL